ncbi:RDD family protein [Kordia sp. YSTF-M3]|uniref:RDD family protein n=1 Tax=Kordia aestuariivivens TaxID=2759037 RepID=A0ABR7Q7H4_9FLAO|nr:RDD family protein [Kordia aestuariivivens]MBC8754488.1 RDD family protein [Kordia aestuariivivens]
MNENYEHGHKLASIGQRFFASFVEGLIYTLLTLVAYLIVGISIFEYESSDFELIDIVYSAIMGLIVGAIFYPLFGGNLGHKIFNLKVISSETGEDYNRAEKGAIRECLKYVLGYLIIPVIWLLWDDNNQNLYDKLTKTLVVEKNRNETN